MSAFCHVDDAYNQIKNDDIDLDKLAREVNEQKKRNAHDIYRNYRVDQTALERGVAAYNNLQRDGKDKGTDVPHITKGFFSAQGEYSDLTTMYDGNEDSGLLISDIIEQKRPQRKLRIKRKKTTNDILKDMVKNTYYDSVNDMQGLNDNEDHNNDRALEISSISDSNSELSDISDISYLNDESSFDTLISNSYVNSHSKPLSKLKPKKLKKKKRPDSNITLEDIYHEIRLGSKYTQRADEAARNVRRKKAKRCIDYDLQSVDSLESLESGESLLEHINECSRCRDQVVDLIRKSRTTKKSELMDQIVSNMNRSNTSDERSTDLVANSDGNAQVSEENGGYELKEILTVCLIGFLVIIILDLTINYKTRFQ